MVWSNASGLAPGIFTFTLTGAEAPKKAFDVPAGDAAATLKQFAQQAGQQVVYPAHDVKGVKTSPVKGEYTLGEALNVMLAGTGLVAAFDEKSSTFAVSRDPDPNAPRLARKNSDQPGSEKSETKDGVLKLETFEVFGQKSLNMDIRRSRDDAQPYVTFNRDSITRSGAATIEDFLKDRLTMNTQAGTAGQSFGGGTGTASYVNLRGLGSNQTLILIDGRRAPTRFDVTGAISQPDLNGIPLAAVERIEVLPTTASGIYGGSALGGVINVILRRDYSGVELKTTYENAFDTDVASKRVDFSVGLALEKGRTNVLLALSYADANVLLLQDRAFMRDYRVRVVENNAGNFDALNRGTFPPQGATPNIRSSTGVNLTLKNGTALNSPRTFVPTGYAGVSTDGGAALVANAGKYNLDLSPASAGGAGRSSAYNSPNLRSGSLTIRRQFVPWLEAYLDTSYSTNTSRIPFAQTEGVYTLPGSSPNNPFNETITVSVPLADPSLEMYNRTTDAKVAAGFVVELPHDWKGNLDYAWGQSFGGYRVVTSMPAALTTAATTGTLDVLRDTRAFPIPVASFGPYFYQEVITAPRLTSRIYSARASGPTFQLPAGPINISGLAEYRTQSTSDGSITFTTATPVLLIPSRSQDIYSGYAEIKVPLVAPAQRLPLVDSLELQVAVRRDDYATTGSTSVSNPTPTTPIPRATNRVNSTDPTVALRWVPAKGIIVRSSYGTGFLPPDMNSLIRRVGATTATILDPKRGNTSTFLPVGQVTFGGNPDLRPEQSKSWSAGVVVTPPAVPGLRVSIDYSKIEKTDNFASLTRQGVVDNEEFLPGRVSRGANLPGDLPGWAGPITFLDFSTVNLAKAVLEAYDLQIDYTLKTEGWGTFDFTLAATELVRLDTQVTPLAPTVKNVGYGVQAAGTDFASPLKLKANAGLTWTRGRWTVNWFTRYSDSYLVYPATSNAAAIAIQVANQGNGGRVKSQVFYDLSVAHRFGGSDEKGWRAAILSDLELSLGLKNVFNTKPAFDSANTSLGYYSVYADPRLASYYISLKKIF